MPPRQACIQRRLWLKNSSNGRVYFTSLPIIWSQLVNPVLEVFWTAFYHFVFPGPPSERSPPCSPLTCSPSSDFSYVFSRDLHHLIATHSADPTLRLCLPSHSALSWLYARTRPSEHQRGWFLKQHSAILLELEKKRSLHSLEEKKNLCITLPPWPRL